MKDERNKVGEETDIAGDGGVQMFGKWPEGECWSFTRSLLLHLADDVSRDGWVEVDGVVAETLRCFVALPTPALEGFAHPYLGSVAILGMILDPIHIL